MRDLGEFEFHLGVKNVLKGFCFYWFVGRFSGDKDFSSRAVAVGISFSGNCYGEILVFVRVSRDYKLEFVVFVCGLEGDIVSHCYGVRVLAEVVGFVEKGHIGENIGKLEFGPLRRLHF